MKIVMFCDKYLYRKLNMAFPKYSENDAVIGSLFQKMSLIIFMYWTKILSTWLLIQWMVSKIFIYS